MMDLKQNPLNSITEDVYLIEYIVAAPDGGPDYSNSMEINVTKREIENNLDISPLNFWRNTVYSRENFKIYKIKKVTKKLD